MICLSLMQVPSLAGLCLKGVLLNGVLRVKDEASLAPERVFLWPHKLCSLRSHPGWSFRVVITVAASSCHLMMKSAWHFVVGFPLSFALKTPDLFFKNKNPPWVFQLPQKWQALHLESFLYSQFNAHLTACICMQVFHYTKFFPMHCNCFHTVKLGSLMKKVLLDKTIRSLRCSVCSDLLLASTRAIPVLALCRATQIPSCPFFLAVSNISDSQSRLQRASSWCLPSML